MSIDTRTLNQDSLHIPQRLSFPPSWIGLIPFAQWLTSISKPKTFVELGVHTGNSFCSICETLERNNISYKAFGIDTWQGDEQAGFYGDEVFEDLKKHTEINFRNNVKLIRSTFDAAEQSFDEKSIDLLHVDGLHTYEAVKNDYKKWLPKISDRGIIIFHDIAVKEGDFGVWKLWSEIKNDYPSFDLEHSHGLGILMVGSKQPEEIINLASLNNNEKEFVRTVYISLSERLNLKYIIQSNEMEIFKLKTERISLLHDIENAHKKISNANTTIIGRVKAYLKKSFN